MGLYQVPRSPQEEDLFRLALSGMNLIYSNPEWPVCRFAHVPLDAANAIPYDQRGWCFFETSVAAAGAKFLITIELGTYVRAIDPVPKTPERFAEEVRSMHFSAKGTDVEKVIQLYEKTWHDVLSKKEFLSVEWGEAEMAEMLELLPHMPDLRTLEIICKQSARDSGACSALKNAMASRGGIANIHLL